MKTKFSRLIGLAAISAIGSTAAMGQGWFECIDPANTQPRSTDFATVGEGNALMTVATGLSGTVGYGDSDTANPPAPCYTQVVQFQIAGGFGFTSGPVGSVQDENPADPNSSFLDDNLVYTFGMPVDPMREGGIAMTIEDTTNTIFGTSGFNEVWNGLSGRYYHIGAVHGNINVQLRVDVIGDTAKLTWDLYNTDQTNAHTIGLWFGHTAAMKSVADDINGASQSYSGLQGVFFRGTKPGFIELPKGRPPITPQRFDRNTDPTNFPEYVNILFGQTAAFGLRMDMGPTEETKDANGNSDATTVDAITIGTANSAPDVFNENGIPDFIIPDTGILGHTQVLQKYNPVLVPALAGNPEIAKRRIVQYFRTPWGKGNYADPYTAVVDAPTLIASDPNGDNGLRPNPMTFRVYIDNAQTLATAGTGIALQEVRVKLTFPGAGLALDAGEPIVKTIPSVAPGQMSAVQWDVVADGIAFGDLPYKVEVESTPGGPKVINGTIRVSTTPKIDIGADANLVGMPWTVSDTSWEAILGLSTPTDFRAYKWDPQQAGYLVTTAAERGFGAWIVASGDFGVLDLQGGPVAPPDIATGAPNIQLKSGWNLISNPYPYAVQLGQIVGVPNGSSASVQTWSQLVSTGLVSSALAYYDNDLADYQFVQGLEGTLFPHRGYWIYLNTQNDLTLAYPPVYARFLPGSSRSSNGSVWQQTDRQWRLQLAARTSKSQDAQNYVGLAKSANDMKTLRQQEIPPSPVATVMLSIDEQIDGQTRSLSQAFTDKLVRKTWKVMARTTEAGTVTITWPNLSTVPKNVRFKITDLATGTVRDLRQTSGYTYNVDDASNREFRLEMIPGTVSKAVIGNVVVTRSRAPLAPFSIRYTLSNDANTSIRVLSSSGKEVFTMHRGRADRTGENEVQWAMRDNANRLVAPGAYRVEILAETTNGDRARKIIPVNVIR